MTKSELDLYRASLNKDPAPSLGNPVGGVPTTEGEVDMADAIVGTGSVVGFDINGENHRGTRDLIQMGFRADGIRDVLEAVRNEGRDSAHQVSSLATQVALGDAASQIAIEKTSAATALNIEKVAAAGVLEATKNAAAQALALEKCCCEIKQLVSAESNTTRALINDVEARHVRDQLADAKQALLVAQLSGNGNGNGN